MKFVDVNNGKVFDRVVNNKIGVVYNNSVYIHCIINDIDNNSISLKNCETSEILRYTIKELNDYNIGFYQTKLF